MTKYPGWRTMTSAQRYNARMHAMFEPRIRELQRDEAELAKRKAAAALKPAKPQEPCDVGLFSDDAAQTDLVEMVNRGRML